MTAITSFLKSVGIRCIRPAVYAWFFNFLFTIFIYYGYYKVFSIPAGGAHIPGEAATGGIRLFTFLNDILLHYKGSLPLVVSLGFLILLAFILVSVYVGGGIYAVLVEKEKTSFTNIIASSTHNFFGMLKVFLINLVTFVAAIFVPLVMLIMFSNTKSLSNSEAAINVFMWVWLFITALFLFLYVAIYDYSRIIKLKEDRNILYSWRKAVVFAFSNFGSLLTMFVLYVLALIILYLLYVVLIGFVHHLLHVFFLFLVYQAFIVSRYYWKIVIIRSEIRYLDEVS